MSRASDPTRAALASAGLVFEVELEDPDGALLGCKLVHAQDEADAELCAAELYPGLTVATIAVVDPPR
jgi:hypothetical protein